MSHWLVLFIRVGHGGGEAFRGGIPQNRGGGGGSRVSFLPQTLFFTTQNFFFNFFSQKTTVTPLRKKNLMRELDLTVLGDSHCGGGDIVNVKFSNFPKINLLKPVNISAWCGLCVCVCCTRTNNPIFSFVAGKIRGGYHWPPPLHDITYQ